MTHALLQRLALATIAGDFGAKETLAVAAKERAAVLRNHDRVDPPTEMLRFFCGHLREVFNAADPGVERTWPNCRAFAFAVFRVGGLDVPDFEAHPDRLDSYLGTDVSAV